jgi:hypothetical protein
VTALGFCGSSSIPNVAIELPDSALQKAGVFEVVNAGWRLLDFNFGSLASLLECGGFFLDRQANLSDIENIGPITHARTPRETVTIPIHAIVQCHSRISGFSQFDRVGIAYRPSESLCHRGQFIHKNAREEEAQWWSESHGVDLQV